MTRLAFWVAAVAAYGLFWFAVAVAIAALGGSSSANAMSLAGLWLVFAVVLPAMLNLLVNTLYPVPSRVELVQALRVATDEANTRGSQLLAAFYEDHPELAAASPAKALNDFNAIRVAVTEQIEREVRPVLATFERQLAAQQRLVDRARFLSPALLMQDVLNDIAGTGTARHRDFLAQVGRYHDAWRGYFVPLVVRKAQLHTLSQVPRFTYAEELLGSVVRRLTLSLSTLLLLAMAIGGAGLVALRRYPIAT